MYEVKRSRRSILYNLNYLFIPFTCFCFTLWSLFAQNTW